MEGRNTSKKAWILKDHRVGSTTQMLALAEVLNLNYELKNIEYRPLISKLPNFLLYGMLHVDKEKSDKLDLSFNAPEVVISAGRKLALISIYLKTQLKRQGSQLKIINLMRPLKSYNFFDYVILPTHDLSSQKGNTIRVLGALNDSINQIKKAVNIDTIYKDIGDFLGIIIGGDSRYFGLTEADNVYLIRLIKKVIKNTSLKIIITFSRRTSLNTKQIIRNSFSNSIIYDPDSSQVNIYYSILKSAKFIICTGDSISMCSEVVSSGKPCYIYPPLKMSNSKKHVRFIDELIKKGLARILDESTRLQSYSYKALDEKSRIAELIKL